MNDQNQHISETDYRRYLNDEMSEVERNAFEKLLQKYPFEAEALEGLQQISAGKFEADMHELGERLQKKSGKTKRIVWWTAAATLLILVTSGILWYNLDRSAGPPQVAETMKDEKSEMAAPDTKSTVEKPVSTIAEKQAGQEKTAVKEPDKKGEPDDAGEQIKINIVEDDAEIDDYVDEFATEEPVEKSTAGQQTETLTESAETPASGREPEIDLVIVENQSAQQQQTEQEAVSDFEFSEPAVSRQANAVTSGAASKANVNAPNLPAQPMINKPDFEAYLHENAILDPGSDADSIVVILNLHVDETGKITQFENVNQTDPRYFRKARKIIRSGPAWQPALRNGVPMKSVVEQKVVFRIK